MEAVRLVTFILVWILWAVLGFIFWIPLLARATASLAAAILYCAVTESDDAQIKESFESAVSFYARGFKILDRVLSTDKAPSEKVSGKTREYKWGQIIVEIIWTGIFWGSFFLFVATVFFDYSLKDSIAISLADAKARSEMAKTYFDTGETKRKEKDCTTAIGQYDNAIKAEPKLALAYFYRGYCYNEIRKFDRAVLDFDEYINFFPTDVFAYNNRGFAHHRLGNTDMAIRNYKKVIELNSDPEMTQKAKETLQELGVQ